MGQSRLILGGQILFVGMLMLCFMLYLDLFRKDYYQRKGSLSLLFTLIVFYSIVTAFMVTHNIFNVYIIPYAMLPIIIRVFLDSRTAFLTHVITILICSISLRFPHEFILTQLAAGLVAIFSLRELSQRSQLFRTALLVILTYAAIYFAFELMTENGLSNVIIDEEQKFGVSVKEKLRQLKVNVDTLTMTATPIPRTLQFSLMGARDLSVISTPPPNRYPIQTEVHTFNEEVITDAINFEMSRNGQVFFVNNRIANLPELKAMIERHIPDCRVAIGHGQMEPTQLEQIIFDFVNYDYDVLLATTIIESGIDIPNANTIIINQAQNFGLSDLHQMRGRVGRSNKKAFCYLLAPPLSSLTAEGKRRLQAIENFSDLGSGIHIAMQDLDIRGAGNLLGAEQSGFIADLGYETYQKILAEAVHELRNDEFAELYADEIKGEGQISGEEFVDECQIESDLELLLPATYVTGSSERMLLYRELDGLTLDKDVDAFRFRLEDRFGPVPPETQELLRIVPLRRLAARLGVEKVFLKGGRMTLFFVSNADSPFYQSQAFGKMIDYMMKYTRRCDLREQNGRRSMLIKDVTNVETAVSVLQEIVALPVKEQDDH